MSGESNMKVVVAVGGGKGGVGKTLVASALARRLYLGGNAVAVIDADFARPSLLASETGKESGISNSDFLTGLVSAVAKTEKKIRGSLRIVSGQDLFPDVANNGWRRDKFARAINKFPEPFVIVDLGPGTDAFTLDCFLQANIGIFVTTPDPFAERDCFHFAQSCLMQGLKCYSQKDPEVKKLLRFLEKRNEQDRVPLKRYLEKFNDGEHMVTTILEEVKANIKTGLVVNMAQGDNDKRDGYTLRTVFQDFLGLEVELWGQIGFDMEFRNKIRNKTEIPLQMTADFHLCAEKLFSVVSLYAISGAGEYKNGRRSNGRELKPQLNGDLTEVICSAKCVLWRECQHRRGGYPCRIMAIGHLKSLEGEKYLNDQNDGN